MKQEQLLSPEVYEVAQWVQEQLEREPYVDVSVTVCQHGRQIRRIDYGITRKRKPNNDGGAGNGGR